MTCAEIIWLRDEPAVPLQALAHALPTEEQEELASFRHPRRQRSFVLSRTLLRKTLALHLRKPEQGIRFTRSRGRLLLAEKSTWQFNLSHAAGLLAIIVADAPCGVDIELPRSVAVEKITQRYFSAAENNYLLGCDPARQRNEFFRLWTLKEAAVKAIGEGLANNLARLAFDIAGEKPQLLDTAVKLKLWQTTGSDFFLAGAVASDKEVFWQVREIKPPLL